MLRALNLLVTVSLLSLLATARADHLSLYTGNYPPLNFSVAEDKINAKDEQVQGFTADVVREILARNRTDCSIHLLPWARGYTEAIEKPNVVLFSMARNQLREHQFKWVGPIARKRTTFFAKKGSVLSINSLEDAKKVDIVSIVRLDSKHKFLEAHGFNNIALSTTAGQGLKQLLLGRVSLWVNTDLDAPAIARELGVGIDAIEPVYSDYEYDLYIGFSLTTSDTIVNRWQKALDEIKNDGTFERIMKRWAAYFEADDWQLKDGMLQVKHGNTLIDASN